MQQVMDPTQEFETTVVKESLVIDEEVESPVFTPLSETTNGGEPTSGAKSHAIAEAAELAVQPLPSRPPNQLFLLKRAVSGAYRSTGTSYQLELRVDVDGRRPMGRVSGDFFMVSGATSSYFGSFIVNVPTVTTTSTLVTIEGMGSFTWSAGSPMIKVTIPRMTIFQPAASATLQFLSVSGTPGATYVCSYRSGYQRTVLYEEDSVAGTIPFLSYNTGSLPQPGTSPTRNLSVQSAFAEAGIAMQPTGGTNVIPTSAAGTDLRWSDAEMHAAMVANFSQWADTPQWKVYMLIATQHVSGYRGIMFDYSDSYQRQGCAVFYDAIQGSDPYNQRAQLRTYVHELGHCFNLLHSWQKHLATPPAPLGPNSGYGDLSWMNYDWKYIPGGAAGYWANFPFQFTDNELVHLRHGFYRNVVLGGNAFATGAAEIDPELFADRIEDNSGLSLELRSKQSYAMGEPVVVEIKLATTDLRGKMVHNYLHPDDTMMHIAIRQPSGRTLPYRPMIVHCAHMEKSTLLTADNPAIYESAYIGYGRDGFYFEHPGTYQVRAIYVAPDGSQVVSNILKLRVHAPYSPEDEEVASLFLDDAQGQLLRLLGSDAPELAAGNNAFEEVLAKHSKHPLAVYARLVLGINAERDFKEIHPDKTLSLRKAKADRSVDLLSKVVEASVADKGVDNITLNMVMTSLAHAESKEGNIEKARKTLDNMPNVFKKKGVNERVLNKISSQVAEEKAKIETI